MRLTYPAILLLGVALLPGCILGGLGTGTIGETGEDTTELEGCAPAGADIELHVEISADFQNSMHELVVCGGLTIKIAVAASQALYELIFESVSDATPGGFQYMGDGTYKSGDASTDMGLRFVYGADYAAGGQGDPILHNIFVLDSYLVSPSVSSNGVTVTVNYDEPGPLVELLGFGATPANPLVLTLADSLTVSSELNKIRVAGDILVDDSAGAATVDYTVNIEPSPVADLILPFGSLDFSLVDAGATREDPAQTLTSTSFGVSYTDSGSELDGAVEFEVRGGEFDYQGTLDYSTGDAYGVLNLSCL